MTLHLATLIALGVANVPPNEVREFPYHHGFVAAGNFATAPDDDLTIILGRYADASGRDCRFELLVSAGCVIRAKGCHLQGQAPLCPEGERS